MFLDYRIEIPPLKYHCDKLLTLVKQIILGVHENRCCNHDVPQGFHTMDDNNGKREEVRQLYLKEKTIKRGRKNDHMSVWIRRDERAAAAEKPNQFIATELSSLLTVQ